MARSATYLQTARMNQRRGSGQVLLRDEGDTRKMSTRFDKVEVTSFLDKSYFKRFKIESETKS